MNAQDRENALTLELLEAIEEKQEITQRHLAQRLGVALGLANSYLKRCVHKGLVKVEQVPANRYMYYLTPQGFAEKGRLTAQYLSSSLAFYRKASASCDQAFQLCVSNGWTRVLLCGVSDLAEIASIRAREHEVTIMGIYDPVVEQEQFLNKPVWRRLEDAGDVDAYFLADLIDPAGNFVSLVEQVPKERIIAPSILGVF
ncbi:hypothetical protein MNBD_GAMMA26-753 [hydrothermal vent metagenome]|uniref:Winged helix-turn-helix transcriptional regulator n=1 Tax=hydrothermal vent metagenome TaxID=652676 RepID=A0A3B1ANG3_9ZZZZ